MGSALESKSLPLITFPSTSTWSPAGCSAITWHSNQARASSSKGGPMRPVVHSVKANLFSATGRLAVMGGQL